MSKRLSCQVVSYHIQTCFVPLLVTRFICNFQIHFWWILKQSPNEPLGSEKNHSGNSRSQKVRWFLLVLQSKFMQYVEGSLAIRKWIPQHSIIIKLSRFRKVPSSDCSVSGELQVCLGNTRITVKFVVWIKQQSGFVSNFSWTHWVLRGYHWPDTLNFADQNQYGLFEMINF